VLAACYWLRRLIIPLLNCGYISAEVYAELSGRRRQVKSKKIAMRNRLALLGVRILPWHFSFRTVVPMNGIFRAEHIMSKHDITSGSASYNFRTRVFSTFTHLSKYDTVSSSRVSVAKDRLEKRHVVDSGEHPEHNDTDDRQRHVPLIEEIYNELMTVPKWLTNDEWSAVGAKVPKYPSVSDRWPTLLLHYIAQKSEAIAGLYDVGMSLVDYIANLSDRHRLLRLVSSVAICIHQGGQDEHEKALALYDELCGEFDVFDHVTARILINALARTRYWRQCMELIEQVKITSDPGSKDYSPIIIAAMINGDDDLANELLAILSRNHLMPDDTVFMHIIDNGTAEQVLAVLKKFAWIPSRPVIDSVIMQLQRYVDSCYYENCLLELFVHDCLQ